jgi:MFS family permease
MLGGVFGLTTVLGPLIGGLFTDGLSWRWAFYVNVPVGIVVIVLSARTIPALRTAGRPVIDYAGIVFVVIESRARELVLPLRLFRDRVFTTCCALSFIVGFAMLGALTFLPTFEQYVFGVSAIISGVRLLPMVIGLMLTSVTAGTIVGRTGRYKVFPVAGSIIIGIGLFLLSRMTETTSAVLSSAYLLVLGLGIGLSMQVLTLIVQNTASYADLGVATSGVTFFRTPRSRRWSTPTPNRWTGSSCGRSPRPRRAARRGRAVRNDARPRGGVGRRRDPPLSPGVRPRGDRRDRPTPPPAVGGPGADVLRAGR